jgi:hypothetical protein
LSRREHYEVAHQYLSGLDDGTTHISHVRALMAHVLFDLGDGARASKLVAEGKDVSGASAAWWAIRGLAAEKNNADSDAAAHDLQEAIAQDPMHIEAACSRAGDDGSHKNPSELCNMATRGGRETKTRAGITKTLSRGAAGD